MVLIGPYHGDSYGGNGTHTAAVGWDGLVIGEIVDLRRKAPFRIDRHGVPVAWAPASSLRVKGARKIAVGIMVIVVEVS